MNNPYLSGVYTPVDGERTYLDLPVEGEVPVDLCGSYVQNSANPRFAPAGPYHWFDGDGMVHGVHFAEGRASYRNRWIATGGLARDLEAGKATHPGILEPIDPDLPGGPDKDTANTDVSFHGGRMLATWWLGGTPQQLSLPDFESTGEFRPTGLPCGIASHAKVDPRTGELVFFDYELYGEPALWFGAIGPGGEVLAAERIPLERPSLLHDIAITERFTVLFDFPMYWDPERLRRGQRRVRFDPEGVTRFGIAPRRGPASEVRWFEASGCYMYHAINAWEEVNGAGETEVVVIGCRIANPVPTRPHGEELHIPRLLLLRLAPVLYEWRLNLDTGSVAERQLDDVYGEFPRGNDTVLGMPSRYSYIPKIAAAPTLMFDGVSKFDRQTGTARRLEFGPGMVGGELSYAPRPGAVDEDDGWLLGFVHDRREASSALWVIDAGELRPVAKVPIPDRVPFGFHSDWAAHG